ncbi:Autophagy-related protein 11 [Cytospora mali]|uniref:Autophagy-related protein 11 n=1 Tax=Cytospora mali TaxID=578113 RepID=A0A194V8V8_CYTMA|nr:Autophagy-related protein 11 [Valsa mali var. pyri (nom. inval.)]
MATQVLIAHTGQHMQLETSQFTTVDDFKAAVSRQSSIPSQYIIALTPQGKPLKLQTLPAEKEIYIYDIRISQPATPGSPPSVNVEISLPKAYNPSQPPNQINDTSSQKSWQELFRARKAWVGKVVDDCAMMAQATGDRYGEMDVMMRCLDAAVANLESVVKTLEPKYQELRKWAAPAQSEYSTLVTKWELYLGLARSIPISAGMASFMTGRSMNSKNKPARQPTLEDLLDLETVKRTARQAPQALRRFNQRVNDLEKTAARMFQNCQDITGDFERAIERSAMSHEEEATQLLEDIEAVAKKIDADYQTTLEFTSTTRDVMQVSKLAATHTERLLPSIRARALEMDGMLRYAIQARNALALESVDFMRSITDITSLTTTVKSQINVLGSEEELATFDYLRLIQQVPFMYASFTVEAMRRREWYEKVKVDASTLANEMAVFQEEEIKRRKKWLKTVENLYGPQTTSGEGNVAGLEVNLLGQEEEWPNMTKQDLTDLYENLQRQKAEPELLNDIGKLIVDLNNPTKQQSKRLKAFKNGSIHEASLGRSGLLLRGDDDVLRSLQDDKQRVEGKLKAAESRVRRLEDLLHRQSQTSRPTFGNMFQTPSQQFSERSGSTTSVKKGPEDPRRLSADLPEGLIQRVQQLEAELNAEKEKSAGFEKDLNACTTQHETVKGQIEEANSTKKDLLENMEALKREFIEERKSLEDDIKLLKARIEDNEDEMEHFGESREHEKAHYDERVQALEDEIAQLAKERKDEILKYEGQVEFLRKESKLQREQCENLERQLNSVQDENRTLAQQLETADHSATSQLNALQDLYRQLAPETEVPQDQGELIESVLGKCADLLANVQVVEANISLLKSELDSQQIFVKDLRHETATVKELLAKEESTTVQLRENLGEEKARVAALEGELDEARKQLNNLRTKIADGETGSESLRMRLDEEEKKITTLTEDLASKQSQVGSLEEELRLYKDKFENSQSKYRVLTERFMARTEHTKDLTQKLYTQNDRIRRLLERLGFSVTRHDGTVVIQRLPRAERSAANLNDSTIDPGASLRKSGILSQTTDGSDLELLYWMNNSDEATESEKYHAFMSELGSFDMDAFTETVYKRVKDIEHMARKLQRDARSYRDKAHTLQKEAHDKIAFKNFKEGDLALFLPTRNQMTGAWAAFNIGFPHYFLREQEAHRLRNREWLLARISRVQERVVDLSKSLNNQAAGNGTAETESMDEENDNPFDLSDGLRWYLIDANEDKPGAPSTPGLGKTTVAANKVDAVAERSQMRTASGKGLGLVGRGTTGIDGVSKTLSRSLESRRSSTSSRKAMPFGIGGRGSVLAGDASSIRAAAADSPDAPAESSGQPVQATEQAHGGRRFRLPSLAAQRQPERSPLQQQQSDGASSVESPSDTKKSVVWDSMWSLDLSYESGRKGK